MNISPNSQIVPSLHSAEGKALSRILNPVPEEDWIILVEEGEEVDVEGALQRLRDRGHVVSRRRSPYGRTVETPE
jgi:hypothetical protein